MGLNRCDEVTAHHCFPAGVEGNSFSTSSLTLKKKKTKKKQTLDGMYALHCLHFFFAYMPFFLY